MKARKCVICNGDIPITMKKTAKYCCEAHSYEARKRRSSESYYRLKRPADEIKRNESILASLYWVRKDLKKQLKISDLESINFNFGLSTEQKVGKNGELWTIIGVFGYYIEPKSKNLFLWKKP